MANIKFKTSLQQNLITILAYDDKSGKIVSLMIDVGLFEGDYRTIADRILRYWQEQGEAPKYHTADLFSDILDDPTNRRASVFRSTLSHMAQLAEHINTKYILNELRAFTRLQRLKDAISRSAQRIESEQELAVEEVEEIWSELLRSREVDFDSPLSLLEVDRVLNYLQTQYNEFSYGIKELDKRFIVPSRSHVTLFLAGTGRGKSWALINSGKQALLSRKKVLHISLEMSEEEVAQRYYQNLFAVPKRKAEVVVTAFQKDRFGRIEALERDSFTPTFAFDSPHIREELQTRLKGLGSKIENLEIVRFPPRSLTPNKLRAYLDNLEVVFNFVPDLIVLDYIGLMQTDAKNHRITLGRTLEDIRAISIERNVAIETGQQTSREGIESSVTKATHVAEDNSLTHTADQVITYSQTDAEYRLGLARLHVSKARNEEDKFTVLLSQSYKIGQFALHSALLEPSYFDTLKQYDSYEDEPAAEEFEE